ncbi:hypothetical protein [Streptomyces sp. NPDC047014]|uniref:hypothetical protein n=1 Tax=Streptomyces sp. NPDC047014 TaxID=3155736 RepID=UPI0033EB6923
MVLSLSVVVLLFVVVWIFVRGGGLKLSHALVCVLLGFLLAGSSLAGTIHDGLTATANVVSGLNP